MKKFLSILLSILIIIPSIILIADEKLPKVDEITKEEAYQFADEIKEMNSSKYDASSRLIVSANKDINYLNAVDVATGIEGLYVLQFPNAETAIEAYDYYDSLSYVNYVEYDIETENALCSTDVEENYDFTPNCYSTIYQNLDDAIKLLEKEGVATPEIRVGVLDSGIAKTQFTKDRIDGGYTYLEDHSTDGTQDGQGHGTLVAGTIILNTLDYVRLYSYQIYDGPGTGSITRAISAIYLAVSENCKIINCSFLFKNGKRSSAMIEAVDYATTQGTIVVCGAGNDSQNIGEYWYPAILKNSITVGSVSSNKKIATSSNFGEAVDIYSFGVYVNSYDNSGGCVTYSGTSAASPMLCSICALLVTAKPDITVDEIKQLLLETGYTTNEENQSDKDRIIADAYGCVKKLLGTELEQIDLDYSVTKNETTGYSDVSFSSNDENVKIYYELGLGSFPYTPYAEMTGSSQYEYNLGETIKLSKWQNITVAAYAPGKEKKILTFSAPAYINESGYRLTEASTTQQYNKIDRCQFIDQKVIEVPETINGVEVQEIGKWCFAGNKSVETIILPDTVKQIDYYAFTNCPNLKTVIAPGVDTCGMYAFYDCKSLTNVEMPNLTYANTGLFKNCISLEIAKLGTLTEIDNHAFYGCENLKLVKTTNDDISFAINTFKDCSILTIYTQNTDTAMYQFAQANSIPVIISFDYEFTGKSKAGFVYADKNTGDTVTYKAENIRKMWDSQCINKTPDFDLLGFLFELNGDEIINAKDFAVLNKAA
ncbi:MAG: S8 family serine peptidase [Eubacterium sp.]